MSNFSKRKIAFQGLKPGMTVFWQEKVLKIIELKDIKITENGLIYQFYVNGDDGILTGLGNKKITVIR